MGVLQSLLDRVGSAVIDRIVNSKVAGDTFDRLYLSAGGRLRLSDGTEDISPLAFSTYAGFMRRPVGGGALEIAGRSGDGLNNVLQASDFARAPISVIGEAGNALWGNDWINTTLGVFLPYGVRMNQYGVLMLGQGSPAVYAHAGPPGNKATWQNATFSLYDGTRLPTVGDWVGTNTTLAADGTYTGSSNPSGYLGVCKVVPATNATTSMTIPAASAMTAVAGRRYHSVIAGRMSTGTGRSVTLGLEFLNASNSVIGSATTSTAVTLPTAPANGAAWGKLSLYASAPTGAVKVRPVVTMTGTLTTDILWFSAFGLWEGLAVMPLNWSPPNVFGDGTQAFAGDMYFQTDTTRYPGRRTWTCWTGGTPDNQRWLTDTRDYAAPGRITWYGHSYLSLVSAVLFNADYLLPSVVGGMLHIDQALIVNRGRDGARLLREGFGAFGNGMTMVANYMRKTSRGAPYLGKDGLNAFLFGINDLADVTSGQGSAGMAQIAGPGTTNNNGGYVHTMRDFIMRSRSAAILHHSNAAFSAKTGSASGNVDYASVPTLDPHDNTGRTFWSMNTVGQTFTFTIPADANEVDEVGISFVGSSGAFGGTITWTGTAGQTGTTTISNTVPSGWGGHGRQVKRFTGMRGKAGLTIIGTVSALDASGSVNLDCAYLVGPQPNMTLVCNCPRAATNAAYAALLGGSYWAGNSGATGDADVATLNASLAGLVAEFGPEVILSDIDAAIGKDPRYYVTDNLHVNEDGVQEMAEDIMTNIINAWAVLNWQQVNQDFHDATLEPIATFTISGNLTTGVRNMPFYVDDYWEIVNTRFAVGTAPTGATAIADINKNGTTIYATTANRPTLAISALVQTAANLALRPDNYYLKPGDRLNLNIAQIGSTVAGADAQITVIGRKIPVP